MSEAAETGGFLRRLSIRSRLIILAIVLLAAMISGSLFVRMALRSAEAAAEAASRIATIVETTNAVHVAFNDLRYWQTDLAVSLLTLSENNAAAARKRLDDQLKLLEGTQPDVARAVRDEAGRFDSLASQAVDAYTNGDRVIGNAHFAEARQHGVVVDQRLNDLDASLRSQARAARSAILPEFSRAATVSLGLTAAAAAIGALLTFVILRSILIPLREIVAAVHGLTTGETEVAIPAAAPDELGQISGALLLLRESLSERERLTQERENQRKTLSDAVESIAEGFALSVPTPSCWSPISASATSIRHTPTSPLAKAHSER
jgi:HAMP domain-containing protein